MLGLPVAGLTAQDVKKRRRQDTQTKIAVFEVRFDKVEDSATPVAVTVRLVKVPPLLTFNLFSIYCLTH